jgi:hypothetical protein
MATILIRNLPDKIDDARLREVLGESQVTNIEYQDDPNPNTSARQALVTLDMPAYEAEQIANKYNGMVLDGKALRISVIHFMA